MENYSDELRAWDKNVSRVKPQHSYRAEGKDAFGRLYRFNHLRRQENPLTKTERNIPAQKVANCELQKRLEVDHHDIADYTANRMADFERAYDVSNRLVCADYVLSLNSKKRIPERIQKRRLLDYLESLEMANLCRNCGNAIKTRICQIYGVDTIVAEIPQHWEVYYCEEKQGMKYHFVERKTIFNSKCECIYREVRKIERAEERKGKTIMF